MICASPLWNLPVVVLQLHNLDNVETLYMDFPLKIDVEGTHWTVNIPGQLLAHQQNSTLGPTYLD